MSQPYARLPGAIDKRVQSIEPTYSDYNFKAPERNLTRGRRSYRFIVDSRDRDRTKYPDPNFYKVLVPEEYTEVISVVLSQAIIPRTDYIINRHNNKIHFEETFGEVLCAEVPPGDYDICTLTSLLCQVMNQVGKSTYYACEVPNQSRIEICSDLSGGDHFFRLRFNQSEDCLGYPKNSIGKVLGFDHVEYLYASGIVYADMDTNTVFGQDTQFCSEFRAGDKFRLEEDYNVYTVDRVISDTQMTIVERFVLDSFEMRLVLGRYRAPFKYDLTGEPYVILDIEELQKTDGIKKTLQDAFAVLPFNNEINKNTVIDLGQSGRIAHAYYFNPPERKLLTLTIRFLTYNGDLYDFNGREHVLDFDIKTLNSQGKYNVLYDFSA